MKLITRNTDYALRALCAIAKNGKEVTSVAQLVAVLKMPRSFLRKIMQKISKTGLIVSSKGKGGGFVLARNPKDIYLTDLIRIFQGELKINECSFKKKKCPQVAVCALKKKIDKIQEYVIKELKSVSIVSLLKIGVKSGKKKDY